jgi:hypothetical protein
MRVCAQVQVPVFPEPPLVFSHELLSALRTGVQELCPLLIPCVLLHVDQGRRSKRVWPGHQIICFILLLVDIEVWCSIGSWSWMLAHLPQAAPIHSNIICIVLLFAGEHTESVPRVHSSKKTESLSTFVLLLRVWKVIKKPIVYAGSLWGS